MKYDVGDWVRVKTLDEMRNIKGAEEDGGHIILENRKYSFPISMHQFCGRNFRVKSLDQNPPAYFLDIGGEYIFYFEDWMLEYAECETNIQEKIKDFAESVEDIPDTNTLKEMEIKAKIFDTVCRESSSTISIDRAAKRCNEVYDIFLSGEHTDNGY